MGITLVLVTHEPDISEYAKRVVVFKDGKIKSDNPIKRRNAAELKNMPPSPMTMMMKNNWQSRPSIIENPYDPIRDHSRRLSSSCEKQDARCAHHAWHHHWRLRCYRQLALEGVSFRARQIESRNESAVCYVGAQNAASEWNGR
jgi:ABC-type sulfate/molybdate transport systems ATPase subunit